MDEISILIITFIIFMMLISFMEKFQNIKNWFKKWKIVDTSCNNVIPHNILTFWLTPQQMKDADRIYKEKGTIEYTFYPCGGIGFGCKVKVWKTNEYIDITDVSNW